MRYWLVMPAAGTSQRFGGAVPKQLAPLAGATVMALALRPFLNDTRCAGAVLALAAAELARQPGPPGAAPRLQHVAGGARRCDSVLRGLEALAPRAAADDWVLVHDAARPCLCALDLEQLLTAGSGHAIGALLAVRVSDTIKQADAAAAAGVTACSEQTIERELLWQAQTPQMFRYAALCRALRSAIDAGRAPTDEAQAFEWLASRPLLVAARFSNLKITTTEDLLIAEALLARRATVAAKGAG